MDAMEDEENRRMILPELKRYIFINIYRFGIWTLYLTIKFRNAKLEDVLAEVRSTAKKEANISQNKNYDVDSIVEVW